jgi:predicted DNA-binding transcriptional regulator AlpA
LLTKAQAASYCQMSPATFDRLCPVTPLRFSERMVLFDVAKIDAWIEGLQAPKNRANRSVDDWIDQMEVGHGRSRPR